MFNSCNNGYSLADIAAATGGNNRNNSDDSWGGGAWWIIILFLFVFCGWGNNGWGNNGNGNNGSNGGGSLTRADLCQDMNFSEMSSGIRGIQQGLCDGFYAQNTNLLNGFSGLQSAVNSGFAGVDNAICTLGYQTQQGVNSINMANMQNTNALQQDINALGIANMQSVNAIQNQLNNCCCTVERGIDGINYNNATNTCALQTSIANATRDIINSQNDTYRALHDEIVANRMADKDATIQQQQAQITALQLAASQAAQNTYLIDQLKPCPSPAYVVPNPYCNCGYNGLSFNSGCGNC